MLLLRITQKRFSATQYALFSSLFAVPRILAGPIAGATVEAVGWQVFYLATMVLGIPGLLMLARFVPPGVREPAFDAEEPAPAVKRPLARSQLVARGIAGGAVVGVGTLAIAALLSALEGLRATPPSFDYLAALAMTASRRASASGCSSSASSLSRSSAGCSSRHGRRREGASAGPTINRRNRRDPQNLLVRSATSGRVFCVQTPAWSALWTTPRGVPSSAASRNAW